MHTQNRRHRLFLALPLFALCVFVSMGGGLVQSRRADLLDVREERIVAETAQRMVEVAGGAVRLEPGAVLERGDGVLRLIAGRALVLADGWLSLQVGNALLTGWSGGWYVTVDDATIGIAALTTPVRMDDAGRTAIIPARMQMTSITDSALFPLPSHFLRAQLPAILDRIDPSMDTRIVVSEDDRDPVLLSLHPERRNAAWTLPLTEDVLLSERLLRVTLLPLSDRLPAALPDQLVRFWADDVADFLATDTASGSFLRETLPVITDHIVTLRRDGYPDRARRFAAALLDILADDPLAARPIIPVLQTIITPSVSVFEGTSSSSVSSGSVVTAQVSMDPIQLTAAVTDHLLQAGFMFTTQTIIVPHGTFAEVSQIVLGTPTGDQLLHFSYDPETDLVSSIEQNGQILPFSLTLEKYVRWVRGE